MKTLQTNFTTTEQSKRLLELGVPTDSADCMNFGNADIFQIPFQRPFSEHLELHVQDGLKKMYTPCWSVGRLMEIYVIARGIDTAYLPIERGEDMVKYLIRLYEEKVKDLDFSKLED